MYLYDMPLSFTMALAQQPKSAEQFRNMTEAQKAEVVTQATRIKSKKEMWSFVTKIGQNLG